MEIEGNGHASHASTSASRDYSSEARARPSVERTELMEFSEDSVVDIPSLQKEQSGIGRWRLPKGDRQQEADGAGLMQIVDVDETEPIRTDDSGSKNETEATQGPKWRRTSVEMGQLSSSQEQRDSGDSGRCDQRLRPPPSTLRITEDDRPISLGKQPDAAAVSSSRSFISMEGHRKPSILKESGSSGQVGTGPSLRGFSSSKRASVEWKIDDEKLVALRSDPTLSNPDETLTSQDQGQFDKTPSFSKSSIRSNSSHASLVDFAIPEDAPASIQEELASGSEGLPPPGRPPADKRKRRQSFLDYFKAGLPETYKPEAPPGTSDMTRQPSMEDRRSSFRSSKSKSFTQSFVGMFKSQGAGGQEREEGVPEGVPAVSRRRGSVVDLFRFNIRPSEEGVRASEEGDEPPGDLRGVARGPKGRRGSMIDLIAPRRASVMDLFSGPRAGRANSNAIESTRRRSSVMQRLLFGNDPDGNDLLAAYEDPVWFTSLEDFRALTHRYHQTKFMDSYFACAIKSGQHHVLKVYYKGKMEASDVKNLHQVLEFAKWLEHEHLVKILGTWETDEAFYIVEEYVIRGDILQDSMSYPERYTEKFLVTKVIHPLLSVLTHLHEQQIMHRSIIPEHLLLGRDDKFVLGHLVKAVNFSASKGKDRIGMLDYMPPEMISIKDERQDVFVTSEQLPVESDSPFGAYTVIGLRDRSESGRLNSRTGSGRLNSRTGSGRQSSGKNSNSSIMVPHNSWEWQESYDEKVDIWQVGCVIHEILCGCLPFETDDHDLTAALILWADVNFWPETLSPECISFLKDCLQKNPEVRPSAEELLKHPWIVKTMAGEGGEAGLPTLAQLRDADKKPASSSSRGGGSLRASKTASSDALEQPSEKGWGFLNGIFGGSQTGSSMRTTPEP